MDLITVKMRSVRGARAFGRRPSADGFRTLLDSFGLFLIRHKLAIPDINR